MRDSTVLSMDKRDSDGFFLRRLAYRTNDRSHNSTDSSLVTVDYQESFLAFHCVAKLLTRQVHGHASYILRNHVQLHMRIFVVTPDV